MKKLETMNYVSPVVEIITVNTFEIICTSPGTDSGNNRGGASEDYPYGGEF